VKGIDKGLKISRGWPVGRGCGPFWSCSRVGGAFYYQVTGGGPSPVENLTFAACMDLQLALILMVSGAVGLLIPDG